MRLQLTNFCGVSGAWNFGDKGIVLLSGKSGTGKTTVIDAIYFALYGKGDKAFSHGKEACKVELEFGALEISRTKKPNRLLVNGVEDEAGQAIINEAFGIAFNTTSYISQNSFESFILLNPVDKLAFIEKFVFVDTNVSEMKKKIKGLIAEKHDALIAASSQYEMMKGIFASKTIPGRIPFPLNRSNDEVSSVDQRSDRLSRGKFLSKEESFLRTKNNESKTLSKLVNYESLIERISREHVQAQLTHQTVNYITETLKGIEEKISTLKGQIPIVGDEEKVKKALQQIVVNDLAKQLSKKTLTLETILSKEKVEREERMVRTAEQLSKLPVSLEKDLKDYDQSLDDIARVARYNLVLEGSRESDEKDLGDAKKELERLQARQVAITLSRDVLPCPKCQAPLQLVNGELVPSALEGESFPRRDSLSRELKEVAIQITVFQEKVSSLSAHISLIKGTQKKKSELLALYDEFPKKEEVEKDRTDCASKVTRRSILQAQLEELQKARVSVAVQNLRREVDTLSAQVGQSEDSFVPKESEEELRAQFDEITRNKIHKIHLETQISALQREKEGYLLTLDKTLRIHALSFSSLREAREISNQLVDLNTKLVLQKERASRISTRLANYNKYLEYEKQLAEYNREKEEVKRLEKTERHAKEMYNACLLLREKVSEAEGISISQFISSVNSHAQIYLDSFFPDSPIVVRLSAFKETKTNIKQQINTTIEYKEREFNSVNTLSGGEINRVILAFTLALGEMFNTPLFLFDECTANLDQEMTGTVISSLRHQFSNKLILVIAHQAIEGCYDRVVGF